MSALWGVKITIMKQAHRRVKKKRVRESERTQGVCALCDFECVGLSQTW